MKATKLIGPASALLAVVALSVAGCSSTGSNSSTVIQPPTPPGLPTPPAVKVPNPPGAPDAPTVGDTVRTEPETPPPTR